MNTREENQINTNTYNAEESRKSFDSTNAKKILNKIYKNILNQKRIYLSVVITIFIILTIITIVNCIHNSHEKEIIKLLANKTFVTDIVENEFHIREFNNKGEFFTYSAQLTDKGTGIERMVDQNSSMQPYDIQITFWGGKYFTGDGRQKIQIDKNNNIISIGGYHPIDSQKENMLNDYRKKLEEKEKQAKKQAEEIENVKSYFPNKTELNKRILEVFPQVNNWNNVGSYIYKDPNNNKNVYMYNENQNDSATVLQINDNIKQAQFIGNTDKITLADGGELTEERYKQMIKLALGDAPEYLKICDLETFKEKAVVEKNDYRQKLYTAEFKGVNYEWQLVYKDGIYTGYYFKIYI